MTRERPAGPASDPRGSRAIGLGLQWKALLWVTLVLGIVHAGFGAWAYSEVSDQHERTILTEVAGYPAILSTLMQQASQVLGDHAIQLADTLAPDQLVKAAGGLELPVARTQMEFTSLEYFDGDGRSIAAWDADGSPPARVPGLQQRVALAASHHRPQSMVACDRDCLVYAIVPAIGHDGRELVVAIGQPVADALLAFRSLSGADVAVLTGTLAPGQVSGDPGTLWSHRVVAATRAPQVLPMLQEMRFTPPPPGAAPEPREAGAQRLRVGLTPFPGAGNEGLKALFLLDETASVEAIERQLSRYVAADLAALMLSSLAVYLLLTPAMRRLQQVTRALPMLADRQFEPARAELRRTAGARVPDEVDVLHATADRLARDLEKLLGAEAANEAKSRFLATMSHEIRTPMNGVLGLLEMVELGPLEASQRHSIEVARESGQALLRIIDDILDFSRIEAKRLEVERAPFSLTDVVESVAQTMGPSAQAKGLCFIAFVDDAIPPRLMGDALRVRQVLLNLCSNAIKFTQQGRVVMTAERAVTADGGVRIDFSVADTGIGLSAEEKTRLFQPFTQADSATTRRFGGTGLGLSIVDALVRLMGGEIVVQSAPGTGSQFAFALTLPEAPDGASSRPRAAPALAGVDAVLWLQDEVEARYVRRTLVALGANVAADSFSSPHAWTIGDAQGTLVAWNDDERRPLTRPLTRARLARILGGGAPVPSRPVIAPAAQRLAGRRVLVAEDHAINQQVIARQLASLGCVVTIADDGARALEYLEREPFDVLIADLHMPVLDGFGLAAAVRRLERERGARARMPIVALSAAALVEDRRRASEAGMDEFLSKPASAVQIAATLERVLGLAAVPPRAAEGSRVAAPAGPGAQRAPPASAAPAAPPAPSTSGSPAADAAVDVDVLLDVAGGDRGFARDLLAEFMRLNTPLFAELPALCSDASLVDLRNRAHRLLGSARTAGAMRLAHALGELEAVAQKGDAASAAATVKRVDAEFARFRDWVRDAAASALGGSAAAPPVA